MHQLFYGCFFKANLENKMVEANDDGQVVPKSIAKTQ